MPEKDPAPDSVTPDPLPRPPSPESPDQIMRMKSESRLSREQEIDEITSMATSRTGYSFSHLDEKKILRKMDMHLLPMLALLYLLSFLDRSNVGNAKIEGLTEDIHCTGSQYNWGLTAFFLAYAAAVVPSNLILKRMRPSIWLPSIMVAWGIVMTLTGIVQTYKGFLAARVFLGITEAGLFPGVAYSITMWYCRHEAHWRQSLFFSAASIAGAFGGILAYGIAKMDGVGGLEGLFTVLVAFASFYTLYDYPETAKFLSQEERAFIVHRLAYQGQVHRDDGIRVYQNNEFAWKYVRDAMTDWQVWLSTIVYWSITCPLYGITLFLPTIIKDLGYKASTAQLMTVPIYVVAAFLAIVTAYASDRMGLRSPLILLSQCVMAAGFIICIVSSEPGVVYAGIFIVAAAIYPAFPANITWLSNNLAGSSKRAAGMAVQIGLGNISGAMASNFYRAKDAPEYTLGHSLELGFICAGILALIVLVISYRLINNQRSKAMNSGAHFGVTVEQLSAQGDRALTYRYCL
ncbi:major facilitator superfamily transporter [Saccharata proteae CBS 121410]|uniref:Major facilitator superfamily transporter n=1 Tax=Saccharata proteae CBS 121410 TaxID=1314787 RepID=A0A9P4LVM4_9PEZI|nr:major facilitator superfamily transporter [Saccharata proteae CBS 121410]